MIEYTITHTFDVPTKVDKKYDKFSPIIKFKKYFAISAQPTTAQVQDALEGRGKRKRKGKDMCIFHICV